MNQWQAWSRQYAHAWQDLARNATAAPQPAAPAPWPQAFEQWARAFAPSSAGPGETVDRLIDSARSYATFMQSMLAAAADNPQAAATPWSEALRQAIPGLAGGVFQHPAAQAWQGMQQQGSAGLAQLLGAFGGLPPVPAMPPADLGELKSWLHLPSFGVMREHQERYQKLALAWVEYQEQLGRYNQLMLAASRRGFELFEAKLAEHEPPGLQIDSLRALYDLWVDAAEEGYAEVALSPAFREAYGALVNAQMRVRALVQQEAERVSGDLGMPTRSELNSIGERLQALRREVRARGGAGADAGLADEVAALRAEFATLKASVKHASPGGPVDDGVKLRRASDEPGAAARPRKSPRGSGERAAAATASGNFASRIEEFASASLGAPRKRAPRATGKPAAGSRKTKR
ncbi:MAG: class III poly(R)-hydroxyalkanoic acid synthase subunit PhaE [Rhodanobacteraceae bacterium]|jgi:class III poly(R)-hydroxyalkanoic acid synthase PhaE subunit|nr:class III poly(R)-hydroxyalkanoic acid synthase subunit PhaE [Rhodanobacteraceae bacterium]